MKQISAMDLYFLIKELKIIENSRIETFYLEDKVFYLKVYIKNLGNKFLTIKIGDFIYLNDKKNTKSSLPSSFTTYLRKNLKNTYIKEIIQIENERIIKIKIEKLIDKEKSIYQINYLFIELFKPGNIILCDENTIIKNMLYRKKFKDRKIIAKEKYILPPKKDLSIFNTNLDKLKIELSESDLSIVKFLAIKFGLGGKFSEEICTITKIDKNKNSNQINEIEISQLINALNLILKQEIKPFKILNEKEEIIDFTPFEFKSISKLKVASNSFNKILIEYFEKNLTKNEDLIEKEFKLQLKKLQNRLKKQIEQKEKILQTYKKNTEIGNKIYENYSLIEELLKSINESAKKDGWEKTIKKIKESKNSKIQIIKKINFKNNEIILDLN